MALTDPDIARLAALDHAHLWHPFTPMRQWRQSDPLIITAGHGIDLIDARGHRYIDGVSSLWCNVHGHRVPEIDNAIRHQLDHISHTTLLGLTHPPAIELAARLAAIAPPGLSSVFFSDAGATATEVAFKMAVGFWYHRGQPQRTTFIALDGAYHGDTFGAMSIGYSDLFHRPYRSLTFQTLFVPPPILHTPHARHRWNLQDTAACDTARDEALAQLEQMLIAHPGQVAAIVIEPLVQGAAGMIVQPPGYLRGVAALARKYDTLLIADEVATGFARTGAMFACDHESISPDLLCLGKGLTGGYLPLAATLATRNIAAAFEGELHEGRTLYHGHTFTGNPLACAAALASIDLIEQRDLPAQVRRRAALAASLLEPLKSHDWVRDVRQMGLMIGIELAPPRAASHKPWTAGGSTSGDFGETDAGPDTPPRRLAFDVCMASRADGLIIRPLGDTVVLMPPPVIDDAALERMIGIVVRQIDRICR